MRYSVVEVRIEHLRSSELMVTFTPWSNNCLSGWSSDAFDRACQVVAPGAHLQHHAAFLDQLNGCRILDDVVPCPMRAGLTARVDRVSTQTPRVLAGMQTVHLEPAARLPLGPRGQTR